VSGGLVEGEGDRRDELLGRRGRGRVGEIAVEHERRHLRIDRQEQPIFGEAKGPDDGGDGGRAREVDEALARLGYEGAEVDEVLDVGVVPRLAEHEAAVGVADQHGGPVEGVEDLDRAGDVRREKRHRRDLLPGRFEARAELGARGGQVDGDPLEAARVEGRAERLPLGRRVPRAMYEDDHGRRAVPGRARGRRALLLRAGGEQEGGGQDGREMVHWVPLSEGKHCLAPC
jgi:hypothetical protein